MTDTPTNTFTNGPLGAIYVKTALPIILVMGMNGLLSVTDALFLGIYVGPDALAAVTLMFPIYMLIVALSTLVSNGMSSLLARAFGAQDLTRARGIFAGAHGLALGLGLALVVLFFFLGRPMALLIAGGSEHLAQMGLIYLQITVFFSPPAVCALGQFGRAAQRGAGWFYGTDEPAGLARQYRLQLCTDCPA